MFTRSDIHNAHSKVKSGADFPRYIQDLKKLGVAYYEAFVRDGHVTYYASDGEYLSSMPNYENLDIAEIAQIDEFKRELEAHQAGETNYMQFIQAAAKAGVHSWKVSTIEMTCAYYDQSGNLLLLEKIPA